MPIIRSSRLYVCYYRLWCAVLGFWLSEEVRCRAAGYGSRLRDVARPFIALIICSKCFGHLYAHHQELEIICVLLPPTVCDALVAGCWSGAGSRLCVRAEGYCSTQSNNIPLPGRVACCPAPDPRQPATKHCTP